MEQKSINILNSIAKCILNNLEDLKIIEINKFGEFVEAKIIDAGEYELYAEV